MGLTNIINKVREKGVRKSIRMLQVKAKKKERFSLEKISPEKRANLEQIFAHEYKRIIIFENHFGYFNIMLQRPQHITRCMADEETLVLYNSYYDVDYRSKERFTKLKDHFYVLDMFYYREAVLAYLSQKQLCEYLMVYSTDTVPLELIKSYEKNAFQIIYEYVDDIDPELIVPKKLDMVSERHRYLIRNRRTTVVTTATKLYNNVKELNPNAEPVLVCNGVEGQAFNLQAATKDQEYLGWLKQDRIKVGYYGALASWVDYELLEKLSEEPKIQIILIGVEHDNSLGESGILQRENVKFFGKKPYDVLAGYANQFDICIIPFLINSITESTSPVKLFEYMSLGKVTVTTALPECRKYDTVMIAEDRDEFVNLVYDAYNKRNDKEYIERIKQCARENDWQAKADALKAVLCKEEEINER